jgi:hypothetical protein
MKYSRGKRREEEVDDAEGLLDSKSFCITTAPKQCTAPSQPVGGWSWWWPVSMMGNKTEFRPANRVGCTDIKVPTGIVCVQK